MVYDCFTFFNELDLLEIRLNVLKDVVDRFVIVEAGETHTGKSKPFYFEENRARYADFSDHIVYLKIERFPEGHDAWWNENYQRNFLIEGLKDARDDDDVLISDLDEIPNPEIVAQWKGTDGVKTFHQCYYAFYLNYQNVRNLNLTTTKMLPYRLVKTAFDGVDVLKNEFLPPDINQGTTLTKIRRRTLPRARGGERILKNAGWHFTCLGGAESLVTKMRAVAPHHDFDPDDPRLTPERMTELIAKGRGPALKMNCFAVPIDGRFPVYICENRERYAALIFNVTPKYLRSVRFARALRTVQGRCIQFAEWVCPRALHNFLHHLRMRLEFSAGIIK